MSGLVTSAVAGRIKTLPDDENTEFTPEISIQSQKLALNKRQRIVEEIKKTQPDVVNIDLSHLFSYQKE